MNTITRVGLIAATLGFSVTGIRSCALKNLEQAAQNTPHVENYRKDTAHFRSGMFQSFDVDTNGVADAYLEFDDGDWYGYVSSNTAPTKKSAKTVFRKMGYSPDLVTVTSPEHIQAAVTIITAKNLVDYHRDLDFHKHAIQYVEQNKVDTTK